MKKTFLFTLYLYLICFFTYSAKACDPDACNIRTSVAIGTGCSVAGAFVSVTYCAATFGIGCLVGTALTSGICGSITKAREKGTQFELFWWISHQNYCVYANN